MGLFICSSLADVEMMTIMQA